jgi:hypothetical protein
MSTGLDLGKCGFDFLFPVDSPMDLLRCVLLVFEDTPLVDWPVAGYGDQPCAIALG